MSSLIRDLKRPKGRERRGLTIIEGVRLVEEALAAGVEVKGAVAGSALEATRRGATLKAAIEQLGTPLERATDRDLQALADTEHPQGIVAVVRPKAWRLDQIRAEHRRPVLVLDRVQDPGNVGTMIRTAFALGAGGVIALKGTAELTAPKVLRASMGAGFRLPALRCEFETFLQWHRDTPTAVWLADAAGRPLNGIKAAGPVAIVIGNEGAGLDPAFDAVANQRIAIPLVESADSLNAAVTAGILLYEVIRGG